MPPMGGVGGHQCPPCRPLLAAHTRTDMPSRGGWDTNVKQLSHTRLDILWEGEGAPMSPRRSSTAAYTCKETCLWGKGHRPMMSVFRPSPATHMYSTCSTDSQTITKRAQNMRRGNSCTCTACTACTASQLCLKIASFNVTIVALALGAVQSRM